MIFLHDILTLSDHFSFFFLIQNFSSYLFSFSNICNFPNYFLIFLSSWEFFPNILTFFQPFIIIVTPRFLPFFQNGFGFTKNIQNYCFSENLIKVKKKIELFYYPTKVKQALKTSPQLWLKHSKKWTLRTKRCLLNIF